MDPDEATGAAVRVEHHDGWSELILNRPARRNALTVPLVLGLVEGLRQLDEDSGVRVVVIRGDGGHFCSGLDLDELIGPANAEARATFSVLWAKLHTRLARTRLVTVGALEGAAVAGGAALALSCDLLVAGRGARLHVSEVARGMTAPVNLAWLMTKHGAGRALDLVVGATPHDGDDLYRLGLATAVCEDDEVLGAARTMAARLASHDPSSVIATKAMISSFRPGEAFEEVLARFQGRA